MLECSCVKAFQFLIQKHDPLPTRRAPTGKGFSTMSRMPERCCGSAGLLVGIADLSAYARSIMVGAEADRIPQLDRGALELHVSHCQLSPSLCVVFRPGVCSSGRMMTKS